MCVEEGPDLFLYKVIQFWTVPDCQKLLNRLTHSLIHSEVVGIPLYSHTQVNPNRNMTNPKLKMPSVHAMPLKVRSILNVNDKLCVEQSKCPD